MFQGRNQNPDLIVRSARVEFVNGWNLFWAEILKKILLRAPERFSYASIPIRAILKFLIRNVLIHFLRAIAGKRKHPFTRAWRLR